MAGVQALQQQEAFLKSTSDADLEAEIEARLHVYCMYSFAFVFAPFVHLSSSLNHLKLPRPTSTLFAQVWRLRQGQ